MAKNKSSQLPRYELLYVVSNKFTSEETEPIAQKVEDLITTNDGNIVYRENWGKRRMSYPIKGFQFGYYRLLEFDLPANKIEEINRYLRLSNDILRHQIIKRQPRTVQEILAAKEEIAKREAKIKDEEANVNQKDKPEAPAEPSSDKTQNTEETIAA